MIKATLENGEYTVFVTDRFDFTVNKDFTAMIGNVPIGVKTVNLNLAQCNYIDSSALGMMLMVRDRCKNKGIDLQIDNPSNAVLQVLHIANFQKLFIIR